MCACNSYLSVYSTGGSFDRLMFVLFILFFVAFAFRTVVSREPKAKATCDWSCMTLYSVGYMEALLPNFFTRRRCHVLYFQSIVCKPVYFSNCLGVELKHYFERVFKKSVCSNDYYNWCNSHVTTLKVWVPCRFIDAGNWKGQELVLNVHLKSALAMEKSHGYRISKWDVTHKKMFDNNALRNACSQLNQVWFETSRKSVRHSVVETHRFKSLQKITIKQTTCILIRTV